MLAVTFALGACEESPLHRADAPPIEDNSTTTIGDALDRAFRQGSRFERINQLTTTLTGLDSTNIQEVLDVYEVEQWWLEDTAIELLMEAWTRFDPEGAIQYALNWPDRTRRPTALSAAIRGWAFRDPHAAASAVERIGTSYPRQRQLFVENLLTGWVQSGQAGFIQYIVDRGESSFLVDSMWVAGGQTRRLGVPRVLDWLDDQVASDLPPKLKLNLVRRVVGMASRLDPTRVATWLKKHEGQEYTNQAATQLAERWLSIDTHAAMDWVAAALPEEEQIPILRSAFTKWLTADFKGAGGWIEAAPTAETYDPAFRAYALVMAQRDPDLAIPWAERITNAESRRTALTRVASSWYRRDAEAAENWLQLSELDEASREQVRGANNRKRVSPLKQP